MEKVRLSDIVDIQIGKTPSRSNKDYWGLGYDWLSISDLNNLEEGKFISKSKEQITKKAIDETKVVEIPQNSVLYSFKLSIGKIAITKRFFYTNEAIAAFIIKDKEQILPDYLFYSLKTIDPISISDHGAKGLILNKDKLSSLLIPITTVDEQNRIVNILDRVQSLITKRKKSINLLKKLILSIFLEMFGDPLLNSNKTKLSKLGDWQSGGTPPSSKIAFFEGNIPWFTSGELNDVFITDSKKKITEEAIRCTSAKKIEKGSLLIGMYDTAALKSSITTVESSCNQAVAFAKLDDSICDIIYVYYALQLSKEYYYSQRLGVRQQNLTVESIKNIEIPLPDVIQQKVFSSKVTKVLNQLSNSQLSLNILHNTFASVINLLFSDEIRKEKSELEKYLADTYLQQSLIDKIETQSFTVYEDYYNAKKLLFQLIDSGKSLIRQEYNTELKAVELKTYSDETYKAQYTRSI